MTKKDDVVLKLVDEKPVLVSFLLDRSGSMDLIKSDTIGGFNAYIKSLKKDYADRVEFTFCQFDSTSFDVVCENRPLTKVEELNDHTFQPRGGTPLIDATYRIIKMAEGHAKDRDTLNIIVLQTDGEENSSRDHNNDEVKEMMAALEAKGYLFIFLGANLDAYEQAGKWGMKAGQTMSYASGQSMDTYTATARATKSYVNAGGGAQGQAMGMFTFDEKLSAGDVHAPPVKPEDKKDEKETA